MHTHDPGLWRHSHDFAAAGQDQAERRTRWVVSLTLGFMVVELLAGWLTGSMALLADGWHMGSHAAALGISAYAYAFARRRRADPRFTFGTGKVSSLAGYSSALLLGAGALWMAVESLSRLAAPVPIRYGDAMLVAAVGLAVNLLSAWLLGHSHAHDHGHPHADAHDDHDHDHRHGHEDRGYEGDRAQGGPAQRHFHGQDHNLRAAYLHVVADALTSVLALAALGLGMVYGWGFMDPLMGIAGALLVGRWAWSLAQESAAVLVDAEDQGSIARQVRAVIESDADNEVADLHVWRVGPAGRACIVSLVTHRPQPVEHYRSLVAAIPGLSHVTVEVNHCRQSDCGPAAAV